MGTTSTTDLIIPEILEEAIQAEFAGARILLGSGAATTSNTLPGDVRGGKTITVPYFNALGEMEDITTEGDALTPEVLTMSQETATVRHSGKAVELTYWAQIAAEYADPYAEVARQFRVITERRVDKALYDAALASLPGSNIHDVYNSGSPVKLDYYEFIAAKTKLGDEQDNIALLSVHSKVYGDLLTTKDGENRPLHVPNTAEGSLLRIGGVPVQVSDRNTVSGDTPAKYTSLIAKRGALAFWYQAVPRVRVAFDPLADTDVIAIHMYYVAHRYMRAPGGTKPGIVKIITN